MYACYTNQKGSNSETKKGRASFFLKDKHSLDLIYIAIKFHQAIPYG